MPVEEYLACHGRSILIGEEAEAGEEGQREEMA